MTGGKARLGVLSLLVCLLHAGCMSLEEMAPPVEQAAAYGGELSTEMLARGRHLYLTKCTKCHAAEPVRDYTASEWHGLMPEMGEETKLSAADEEAVLQYVLAAGKVPAG
jgi:cytochrome c5